MSSFPSDDDGPRGSGRTTRQLAGVPVNGTFVVPQNSMISMAKQIAMKIERPDIRIVSMGGGSYVVLRNRTDGLAMGPNMVTLDHSCWHFMSITDRIYTLELQDIRGW